MNSPNISLVQVPSSVASTEKVAEVIELIASKCLKVAGIKGKLVPQLIHYICLLIENLITSSKNIDKFNDVFVPVVRLLFPNISQSEIDDANVVVEHLLELKLIKKVPLIKKAGYYGVEIAKKIFAKFFLGN